MAPENDFVAAEVAKSYVSALTGIVIDKGFLPGLDEKMLDYFPDVPVTDPRKWDITIREMLQMRAGFPWEEKNPLCKGKQEKKLIIH